MSNHIKVSTQDRITTITMARPDRKNAITQDMYGAMADAITAYGQDDSARALVITGEGDMFTSGNDLQDFAIGGDHDVPPVIRFLMAIKDCTKPMIAAVNGPAIGVGLTMLLHCDLVYGGESATFAAPFVKVGVVPEAGSSQLLPAVVGMAVANDIILAGRTLSAAEALQFGLISRVFADDQLTAEVGKIAAHIAASAPNAMIESKKLIRHNRDAIGELMAVEAKKFSAQLKSPEFAEVAMAFMQKRAPKFG